MKKLLLIDGSNVMFRAYYATAYSGNLMQNSKGEYTNAVYGLANMLGGIANETFTHAIIAFDKGKKTFRHQDFEDYKAKRKPMPEEFKSQLPKIRDIIDRFGFFQYEREDVEADDIIASLATTYYDDFDDIEIISNDKDLFQLLNKKVSIRLSKRGIQPEKRYREADLKEEMGLKPHQIPDLKGLMGDSSDNLPGIPGVGEKTALKLLHEYGSVEKLLEHQNELKGKLKERVEHNSKQALMCKRLATVITDATFEFSLDDLCYRGIDKQALAAFYQDMEFHSMIRRLNVETETADTTLTKITRADAAHFDDENILVCERFGENYHHAEGLAFAWKNTKGAYWMPYQEALNDDVFVRFLADEKAQKTTFDIKALDVLLARADRIVRGVAFDALLAAYVINPAYTTEDFKVVVEHFGVHAVPYRDLVYGKGAKLEKPDNDTLVDYMASQLEALAIVRPVMEQQLEEQDQMTLYADVELPLARTLACMEKTGIRMDVKALDQLESMLDENIAAVTARVHEHAGESFNVGSPKQLGDILFEKLKLPAHKRSKTGYSTSVDVLEKLRDKHPIIEDVMHYRRLTKMQSTYVRGLHEAIADDGKIHTIYKQALTRTGRLSSIEPNLQNIPIRTDLGRQIRKVFIPEEGDTLMAADYSQIELRVLAHMAEEKHMIHAFEQDEDIHTATARELFDVERVTADRRRIAKAVNFGIIYGQSAWSLSDDLGISMNEAKTFIERYYRRFPGIAKFMDGIIHHAEKHGYVTTLMNRRRYIPELESSIYAQREFGKRTAMNAPIQGTAADIIKRAMVEIDHAMRAKHMRSTLVLQIHDELVFNVVPEETKAMRALIRDVMENAFKLKAPLRVDLAEGDNLNDAK